MPNTSVPAAAEGVPEDAISALLIKAIDKIGDARAFIDLLNYALDAMSSAGDREINAIQFGLKQIATEVVEAVRTLEQARKVVRKPIPAPDLEMMRLEACLQAHEEALEAFAGICDPDQSTEQERAAAERAEAAAFDQVLQFACTAPTSRIRKVGYLLEHFGKNRFSLELDVHQLKILLDSVIL